VCSVKPKKSLLLLACAVALLVSALGACGEGSGGGTTTMVAPMTTVAPATAAAPTTSVSPTTAGQTMDEELVGIWANEQGIEVEFTSDGRFILRYQDQEGETACSSKEGIAYYVSIEANAAGERLPKETPYIVDGDTLTWDSGKNQVTFTRKQ